MTNTKYNFNEIDPKSYLSSYKDEDGNYVYFSNYNSSANSTSPPIDDVNPLEVLKDFNLPKLHKKYQRPYFSPCHNSWEINYVIVPYPNSQRRVYNRKYFFYLFIININTKYLVVSSGYTKITDHVVNVLSI
jgi:hypothetical protein